MRVRRARAEEGDDHRIRLGAARLSEDERENDERDWSEALAYHATDPQIGCIVSSGTTLEPQRRVAAARQALTGKITGYDKQFCCVLPATLRLAISTDELTLPRR